MPKYLPGPRHPWPFWEGRPGWSDAHAWIQNSSIFGGDTGASSGSHLPLGFQSPTSYGHCRSKTDFVFGLCPHLHVGALGMSCPSPRCACPQCPISGGPACATCTTSKRLQVWPFHAGGSDGKGRLAHGKGCDLQSTCTNPSVISHGGRQHIAPRATS